MGTLCDLRDGKKKTRELLTQYLSIVLPDVLIAIIAEYAQPVTLINDNADPPKADGIPVSYQEGEGLARMIGAECYHEIKCATSSLEVEALKGAMLEHFDRQKPWTTNKRGCTIV